MLSFSRRPAQPLPGSSTLRSCGGLNHLEQLGVQPRGENSSRRSGAISIGTPAGMIAVFNSVPSLEGEAPRNSRAEARMPGGALLSAQECLVMESLGYKSRVY